MTKRESTIIKIPVDKLTPGAVLHSGHMIVGVVDDQDGVWLSLSDGLTIKVRSYDTCHLLILKGEFSDG